MTLRETWRFMTGFFSFALVFGHCLVVRGDDFVNFFSPPTASTKAGGIELQPSSFSGTYQQIFDASLFSSLPAGGGSLRTIVLRASEHSVPVVGTISGVTIDVSTTTKTVDALSPVFSENLGTDNQSFWTGQPVIFDANTFANGLQDWSVAFPVRAAQGFSYDPSKGNLLVTFHNLHLPNVDSRLGLDGVRGASQSASVQSPDSLLSGTLSRDSLVALLIMVPAVPEPSTYVLLGLGMGALWSLGRRSPRRKDANGVS